MKTNPNDPAFPNIIGIQQTHDQCWPETVGGLTKRDLFAAFAMAGIEASNSLDSYLTSKEVARRAQENADALIEKLNEGVDKKEEKNGS